MKNYPDDINQYNSDPRSPLHEDAEDAFEEVDEEEYCEECGDLLEHCWCNELE